MDRYVQDEIDIRDYAEERRAHKEEPRLVPAKKSLGKVAKKPFAVGDHVEIANRLVLSLKNESTTVFSEGDFYQYQEARGVFEALPCERLSLEIQDYSGSKVANEKKPLKIKKSDVSGSISLAGDQLADREFFDNAAPGVVFSDCYVSVTADGITTHPHSPDHRARFGYGFAYQPGANPFRWLAFLDQVFRDDDDRAEKIAALQEFTGACILGIATRYQKALVQVGAGDNGKGVESLHIEGCMPPGSVCSIPPQEMGQEYRRAMMAGKRLNVVSELPEADIMDSEAWKATVTGDSMTGRPIRGAPFPFRPIAGHLYSANRLPGTTDQTHGFWRRLLVLEFNRVFARHEQDRDLARKLALDIPATVSWALDGAARLMRHGRYTEPASSAKALDDWRQKSDQVREFVDEKTERLPLEASKLDGTKADVLYQYYRSWAPDCGHKPMAKNKFGERMKLLKLASEHTNVGNFYPVRLRGEW